MPNSQPMTAARCAEIRRQSLAAIIRPPGDTAQLAAMLDRAMHELELVYQGGPQTPEMVELLKEWGAI